MSETLYLWTLMAGAIATGYALRWWQTRPEVWWHDGYLRAQADRMARQQIREALEKVRARHHA